LQDTLTGREDIVEQLNEKELDISHVQGFLEEWLKDEPVVVKENLQTLIDGVAHYRQRYLDGQEDYARLLENYNRLAGLSAQYLQQAQQQKEQMDQFLIEDQREFHRRDNE
jgi:hypothetical protein